MYWGSIRPYIDQIQTLATSRQLHQSVSENIQPHVGKFSTLSYFEIAPRNHE